MDLVFGLQRTASAAVSLSERASPPGDRHTSEYEQHDARGLGDGRSGCSRSDFIATIRECRHQVAAISQAIAVEITRRPNRIRVRLVSTGRKDRDQVTRVELTVQVRVANPTVL